MIPKTLQQLLDKKQLGHATMLVGINQSQWSEIISKIGQAIEVSQADTTSIIAVPKIEDLREIIKKIYLRPINSQNSLLVIYHLELWRPEIANVLLKTIEEPPEFVKIILFTKNLFAVLPTIKSRVNTFYLTDDRLYDNDKSIPTLEQMSTKTLNEQFKQIIDLIEKNSLSDIINHWLITAPVNFQNYLLELTNLIGNVPVNKRLALELIVVKYYQQYNLKGGEDVS